MKIDSLSAAFTTDKVEASHDFYLKYFGATVTFDCGWYVNLQFGSESATLQFMSPQRPEQQLSNSAGLTYNFAVGDVDAEHIKLTDAGLDVIVPLDDHPWGDRGFAVQDPNGISLYIYSDREPSEEFKHCYKKS